MVQSTPGLIHGGIGSVINKRRLGWYRRENAVLTSDLYTSFSRCYTSRVNSFTCVGTVVVNSDFADLQGAATGNASDLDMAVTLQQLDKSIKIIKLLLY